MATTTELFNLAVQHHQGGMLPQAEALYRQVLDGEPTHAPAHYLLGLLAHQAGRYEVAIALIRHAIALSPPNAEWHFTLGLALMSQGQTADAIASYRLALRHNPNYSQAHNNLGNALKSQGQLDAAIECYRQALCSDPRNANAHYNLGNALKDQGHVTEAADCYRQAIAHNPRHANAHNNLGILLGSQGLLQKATACYRQALLCNPNHADAHNNLGSALKEQGQLAEAIECYRRALAIDPHSADAHVNLGMALKAKGHVDEAVANYRQALLLNPIHADAHINLGNALKEQGQFAEAISCYRQAVHINPLQADAHHNLSIAVTPFGLFEEALEHNAEALRLQPDHVEARWQRSLLRLLHGDFEAGWRDYEQRWTQPHIKARTFQQPRWDGTPFGGKTLFVYAEQGLGDTIQFVRYLPMVKARGGTVLFGCPPGLESLCTGLAGVDQLIGGGATLPPFDLQVPLLSLPALVGTNLASIPAVIPYLHADPGLVAYWREELKSLDGFRIGITWQGSPKNTSDRFRSFPLSQFETLARVPGVQLVSLQKGPADQPDQEPERRLQAPSPSTKAFPYLDLSDRLDTKGAFLDTAAVMMNLDLVVTVDTAIAHLAGALGVPVWTLLMLTPDWRWLLDRTDSPWYPTMRLFRQKQVADWTEVIQCVAVEVQARISLSPALARGNEK
jgi:tetratricopeptide (TPR) repeat protein